MQKYLYRFLTGALSATLLAGLSVPALAWGEQEGLTRAQTRDILLSAADDYNPGLTEGDILKGDETGSLQLDRVVTRIEALVMLERAFGGLPAPVGDNARSAFPAETFTDVPEWAKSELAGVFSAGIVAGTGEGTLSPYRPVTEAELDLLIRRIYALKGTNLKDDFYAAVNKEWLDASTIQTGYLMSGTVYDLTYQVDGQLADLIEEIAMQPQKAGSAEAKISALYHTILDTDSREAAGVGPIRGYLDALEQAENLDALMDAECRIEEETGISTLMGFDLMSDPADSSRYMVAFSTFSPDMEQDFYASQTQQKKDLYLKYLTKLFSLSGYDEETSAGKAQQIYTLDAAISAASLNPQEQYDVDKTTNLYTPAALFGLFSEVNMEKVFAASGLKPVDTILVSDKNAMETAALFFNEEHLEALKAEAQVGLIGSLSASLNQAFTDATLDFQEDYYDVEGRRTAEQIAAQQVQNVLADYLSRVYAETFFSPQSKADIEDMVADFLSIYAERLQKLEWMSAETKAKALKKLRAIRVKVGYPDSWETWLDRAQILSPEEGGTFFSNVIAIQMANRDDLLSRQNQPVDKSKWFCPAYMVNAFYDPSANEILFPAGILQAPLYDVHASREENLGGIGYIIAHEITHAFDNNGCKYDETGNVVTSVENPYGWWTEEDYSAFLNRCEDVVAWYDGLEEVPGITCSGALTISENVADLGSANCIVEAASREASPDYETLFRAIARSWASTSSREIRQYFSKADVHAPDKLRVNRVLQTIPLFYETFDIQEGDGMWTEPESRVSIW